MPFAAFTFPFFGPEYHCSGIDLVLWLFLLLAAFHGYRSGLIQQLFSLAGILGGLFLAHFWKSPAESWLLKLGASPEWAGLWAYIAVVLFFFLIMVIAGKVVTLLADLTPVGFLNRGLGIFFSLVQAAFILGLLCMGIEFFNQQHHFANPALFEQSRLFLFLSHAVRSILFPGGIPFFWLKTTQIQYFYEV